MDILCTTCCEPWDIDTVLHDEPELFTFNKDDVLVKCPECDSNLPLSSDQEERRQIVKELSTYLGSDLDGLAATLEDFNLL